MSDATASLQTENVVALTEINQELDLAPVAQDINDAQYDPDQFPGVVHRMQDPKAAALIFRSGQIVVTGAQSRDSVDTAVRRVFGVLRDLGVDVPDEPKYTVQNMVVSGDLGHELDLSAVAVGLGLEHIEYEPEQFPGLIYRVEDPDTAVLLFNSGKLVITGGTQPTDAEQTLDVLLSQLEELGLKKLSS